MMKDFLQIKFNGSPNPTLGVELELFTLDKKTLSLTNAAPEILNHFKDNFFFKEELLECIVEITTDVCNNVDEIYDDLRPSLIWQLSMLIIMDLSYFQCLSIHFLRFQIRTLLVINVIQSF